MAVLPVPMGMGVPMFFAAIMSHWRDSTLRCRLFTRVRGIRILRSSYTRRSKKFGLWGNPATVPPTTKRARVLRRVFGADSSGGCYKHLVHAPPVHIQDLEGVALPIEAVASCRNAPQVVHHHAAHRVVVCLLLARQHAEPQVLPKLVSPIRPSTIREPSSRRTMGASAGSSSSGTSPISASSTSASVTRPSICPRSSITKDTGRPDLLNASKALVAGALYPRHHLQVEDGEAARVGLLHAHQGHVPPPR